MIQDVESSPWQRPELWAEMEMSLFTAAGALSMENSSLLSSLTQQIARNYESIDEILTTLCRQSCPSCDDVCCRHATVWYDFRDVLFSCFHKQTIPVRQIHKKENGVCMHLQADGCRLARLERPFICTWYVCPLQKQLLDGGDEKVRVQCADSLDEIKRTRKQLEELFCSFV
ncbi:hypothetical protein [Desulfopila sp. IMCC35008]|uniref:hypothetical protein n=1 Tax=Desulfopila sp. IMCC35008 TaxID=2653858 RepID=UPI0013D3B684|nr:hypothetical protein [Desulfopila sp. IMCC35008]